MTFDLNNIKYAAACHTNFQFARRDIEAALGVAQ